MAERPGDEDRDRGGDRQRDPRRTQDEEHADRQIREGEHAVERVAQLARERPGAAPFQPRAPFVGHEDPAESQPEQQRDEIRVDLLHFEEAVADRPGAAEDVDPFLRHVRQHEPPIQPPEQIRQDVRSPRIVARDAVAEHDVGVARGQDAMELEREIERLLEIRGDHREELSAPVLQAGRDRRERSEIAAERDELGAHGPRRELLLKDGEARVGRAVDDEDDFESAAHPRRERLELGEEPGQVVLVPVDRDHEGQHQRRPTIA